MPWIKTKNLKKKKYFVKFNDSPCNKFKFIQKSAKGEGFTLCTVCGSNFSVVYVDAVQQKKKLTDLGASST